MIVIGSQLDSPLTWNDDVEAGRQLTFASSWVAGGLLLVLLLLVVLSSPGARPAFRVDAVEHVASVVVDVAELSHDAEALRLRLDHARVARHVRPLDEVLARLQTSLVITTYVTPSVYYIILY